MKLSVRIEPQAEFMAALAQLSAYYRKMVFKPLLDGMDKEFRSLVGRTTRGFAVKPQVLVKKSTRRSNITFEGGINSYIWHLLDKGTPPHFIRAAPGKVLAFYSDYTPGTRVNSLDTMPPTYSGTLLFRKQVEHTGFEGRNWSYLIHYHLEKYATEEAAQLASKATALLQ